LAEPAPAVVGTAAPRHKKRQRTRQRPADGTRFPSVRGADPDCKYKLVFNGQGGRLVDEHKMNGWEVVYFAKDGPRLSVGQTCRPGDPIEYEGHTLMDIHKDDWEDIQNEGQVEQDKIDEIILDKKHGPLDKSRGIRADAAGIRIINETKPDKRTRVLPPDEQENDDG